MAVELAPLIAVGSPSAIGIVLLTLAVKSYFDKRNDNRLQAASEVETDSGIVDNAKKVIDLVRGETDRMEARIVGLTELAEKAENKNRELEAHINRQDDIIARQERAIEWLTEDLRKAREEIDQLRNSS